MSCNKAIEFRRKYRELIDNAPELDDNISWQMSLKFLSLDYKKHKKKCEICKYFEVKDDK
jgi:hypothetical protein